MPHWILHDHETRKTIDTEQGTLHAAIRSAKERWPGCLVLVQEGDTVFSSPICVYLDMDDMADRAAIGEIVVAKHEAYQDAAP